MTKDEEDYWKELEDQKKAKEAEEIRFKEMAARSAEVWYASKDGHVKKVLESLGWPETIMSSDIPCPPELTSNEFNASFPFSLKRLGYRPVKNPNSKDGRWRIKGRKYAAMYTKVA